MLPIAQTSFQIDPKRFQQVAMEFLKKYLFNGIFC